MSNSQTWALDVATAYDEAWTSKDVDTAMSYIAEDIVCDAPAGMINGAPAYREFIEQFNQIFLGAELLNSYSDGDTAVIVQELNTRAASGAPAVSRFTVQAGKITHILMIFDRLPYAEAQQAAAAAQ